MLYKVDLSLKSVDEKSVCDRSNEMKAVAGAVLS